MIDINITPPANIISYGMIVTPFVDKVVCIFPEADPKNDRMS
jgi:hypothetical protein